MHNLSENAIRFSWTEPCKFLYGKTIKGIEGIVNFASETYGYNKDTARLLRHNLELQREAHLKGMRGFVKGITEIFQKLLQERADKNRITSIRKATFIGNNKVQIGKTIYNLPKPLEVPNLPTAIENNYVTALLSVYSQKEKKVYLKMFHSQTTMPAIMVVQFIQQRT